MLLRLNSSQIHNNIFLIIVFNIDVPYLLCSSAIEFLLSVFFLQSVLTQFHFLLGEEIGPNVEGILVTR